MTDRLLHSLLRVLLSCTKGPRICPRSARPPASKSFAGTHHRPPACTQPLNQRPQGSSLSLAALEALTDVRRPCAGAARLSRLQQGCQSCRHTAPVLQGRPCHGPTDTQGVTLFSSLLRPSAAAPESGPCTQSQRRVSGTKTDALPVSSSAGGAGAAEPEDDRAKLLRAQELSTAHNGSNTSTDMGTRRC